jgi:hypothetical protein
MRTTNTDIVAQNKIFLWLALAVGLVLLVPLVAMRFSEDVVWSLGDFAFAAVLLYGTGALFILAARRFSRHRVILGVVIGAALLYVWAEFAVGVFTGLGS